MTIKINKKFSKVQNTSKDDLGDYSVETENVPLGSPVKGNTP